MSMRLVVASALTIFTLSQANAADLLITQGTAKKGGASSVALDIVSDGDVRGFDFIIPVEEGTKVDTAKCLSGLPTGFQGVCKFNGTEVAGMVFSFEPITLPKGIHSIGSITFSGRTHTSKALTVQFNAADTNAKAIPSAVRVD